MLSPLWPPRYAGGQRVPSPVATGEGEGGGELAPRPLLTR